MKKYEKIERIQRFAQKEKERKGKKESGFGLQEGKEKRQNTKSTRKILNYKENKAITKIKALPSQESKR